MNKQIRGLAVVLMVLFGVLFAQINYLQLFHAQALNDNPLNTRAVLRDFSQPRGVVQTADGVVVAKSVASADEFQRQRQYPAASLYAHLTGFLSFTYGAEGVERQYNDELVGRNQKLQLKNLSDLLVKHEKTGDVTLTVSNRIQQVAADRLGARKGAVVALDPSTGAVLALADYPSYDPNALASHNSAQVKAAWDKLNADPDKPLLSRAYRERYFPGSSFKVVTSSVALATGAVTTSKPVYPSLSELPLPNSGGQTLRNFGGEVCGGNIVQALQVSCNTAFAQLGMDLGADKLSAGAAQFGFGKAPPIDLPFAAASAFPDAGAFAQDKPGLAKSAIGQQDVQATPLEMALVAAGIANKGVIMAPHVLSEVHDSEGNLMTRYSPKPWMQAVTPDVAATVRDMMVAVVNGGTGTAAAIPGVQVAGKTGTAQTGVGTTHVWFISFAPADNPKVAVAVMLESLPLESEATGGTVAAPIAKAVMQAALSGG